MPNLLYFRGLTIRFVSIRLEVQFRIAPTKAKFNKENVQYETVRHDMAFPHLLYFSLWPICGRSSLELEYNEMTGTLFLYLVPSEYIFISSQISVTRFKAPTNMQKNLPIENLLDEYFKALNATYSTHDASEYSYRSALENLLNSLLQPEYQAINEPRNMTCGKPDISIIRKRDAVTVGSIETKDINKPDLEGKGRNQEQFDRYKKAMNHAVFTDYLRFLFYESGNDTPILDIRIGTCQNDEIIPDNEKGKQLCSFLRKYIGKKIQPIRSATTLADLMAKKSQLMCAILTDLLKENGKDNASGLLKKTYTDLKDSLIQNLDEDGFAKIYSQTVAYGLFAARLNDSTPENFSRAEAAELIPKTNKLLRGIFNDLAGNTIHERISWIIDDLVEMFGATNLQKMFERDIRNNRDPLIHFYEDFLKAFNSADRKNFGVWYTPLPIVKFIVDSIDILLKNKLSIEEGLADTTTIIHKTLDGETELSQVQILDPAVGTGTFLAEIINHIADQYKGQETLWQKYVHSCLLPRLYGFEIQMASYTVAHIKFDMVLAHTGYKTEKDDAFHICLTDSLRKPNKTGESNTGYWISLEQAEADRIKSQRPIMVMLGNPPYNGESQNKADEIEELIEKYKQEPDQILKKNEKAKKIADTKWLNNDYVKFIALAQRFIEENGKGIIGYITPNTHLDSLTFRGMRYQLLKTFDNIYIINLHGSNKTKETCPDGSKDENVFGIESGVCITLFVKTGTEKGESSLAKVYYKDVYGKKKDKFDFLEQNDLLALDFEEVTPTSPMYFLLPIKKNMETEFGQGFSVEELFIKRGLGMRTHRDNIAYQANLSDIKSIIEDFKFLEESEIKKKYNITKESRDQKVAYAQRNVKEFGIKDEFFKKALVRPFDSKFTYFTNRSKGFIAFPVYDTMRHLTHQDLSKNLGLIIGKSGNVVGDMPWNLCFVTNTIVDLNIFYRGGGYVYPLYVDTSKAVNQGNSSTQELGDEKESIISNLNGDIIKKLSDFLGVEPSPEDLLDYIYAILHSSNYRDKFKEQLKYQFPRIPYPQNEEEFKKLASLGNHLRHLHLMDNTATWNAKSQFPFKGNGSSIIVKPQWKDDKVYINKENYYDNVPEVVWRYYIGGYQIAEKWLKDRKGTELDFNAIIHYSNILYVLTQTIYLSKEIDKIYI